MAEKSDKAPIIVKRIKKGHHGHHGGAWKVAFADFTTAMMAFFLLLWLVGGSSTEQKAAISKYFKDPGGAFIGDGGIDTGVIQMEAARLPPAEETPEVLAPGAAKSEDDLRGQTADETFYQKQAEEKKDYKQLEDLREDVKNLMSSDKALMEFGDQVLVDLTKEGLRIQIVDKEKRPMFDLSSPVLKPYSELILANLGKAIEKVPNKLSITGHTDATPYVSRANYSNWELSTERANAARRALIKGGLSPNHIAKVEGLADSVAFNKQDPYDPINRRISIVVLKRSAEQQIQDDALAPLDDWWVSRPQSLRSDDVSIDEIPIPEY